MNRANTKWTVLLMIAIIMAALTFSVHYIARQSVLVAILTDRHIWGRDFPAALASSYGWNTIGEHTMIIMGRNVHGGTAYRICHYDNCKAAQQANTLADKLTQAV